MAREPDKLDCETISWKHINSLLEVVNHRILASLDGYSVHILNWQDILEPGFAPEDMKRFISSNVLPRPRDFIFFFQRCFYNARSRGASYLSQQDFNGAMIEYSEHAFKSLCAESQPYIPNMENILYEFAGENKILSLDAVVERLRKAGIAKRNIKKTINYLIESSFLGFEIKDSIFHFPITPRALLIAAKKVWAPRKFIQKPERLKIHNAFHNALLLG